MVDQPSKSDLEAVFQRLRTIPSNKTCFDCGAKNPTWASVTYGVFICIDCSASHRNLGVHLSFVRSTQLDTNWTWTQLRQMQVGGNANAQQFFQQHNCITEDTQKKYTSRAATLYRDKVHQLALKAMENNVQLHLQPVVHEEKPAQKEVDFFTEAENFVIPESASLQIEVQDVKPTAKVPILAAGEGPKVDFSSPQEEQRKPTIGIRKIQPKKSGLGMKRSGLGATKVKANFAEIEREATLAEESRLRMHEENVRAAELTTKEQEEREASVRLAYKDLSQEQQKREEQMKKIDPKKAEQMERLGMGFHSRSGVSHSVSNDMQTIEQENDRSAAASALSKLKLGESSFFDDYYTSISMNRNANSSLFEAAGKSSDFFDGFGASAKDNWVIVDDPAPEKPKAKPMAPIERTPTRRSDATSSAPSSDAAQKKFGGAKAISSEQFFHDRDGDGTEKANLSRFQGSSSISSSEYFGNGGDDFGPNKFQPPDLEDVRESLRQGVTKVAGRITSLANGVVNSLQERYGY